MLGLRVGDLVSLTEYLRVQIGALVSIVWGNQLKGCQMGFFCFRTASKHVCTLDWSQSFLYRSIPNPRTMSPFD